MEPPQQSPERQVPGRHFDDQYAEEVILSDGQKVLLRLLQPGDKELVRGGFAALSMRSRYRRFLTGKARLSERELAYLTELDQKDHFALGAICVDDRGQAQGVGIARFVRSPGRPEIAEPAVVVIDRLHGRGLGRILCERLAEAARERGVQAFRCEVLASNTPMRALIDSLSPHAQIEQHGEAATIEFALNAPAPSPTPRPGPSPEASPAAPPPPTITPPDVTASPASPATPATMINYLLRLASRGAMVVVHRALARWGQHEA